MNKSAHFSVNLNLIIELCRREIHGRYKQSILGFVWPFIIPIVMLVVFTFVFGRVFNIRWPELPGDSQLDIAIFLFCGLVVHGFFTQCLSRAPKLIIENVNLVKKVVFPLEILAFVAIGSELFHAGISLFILILFSIVVSDSLHLTILLLPLIWLPMIILLLGISWMLSSLGVYIRDISQLIAPASMALLFLAPVFYPLSSLSQSMQSYIYLNPITYIVESTRAVVLWGSQPDWSLWGIYMLVSVAVSWIGYRMFMQLRKGFADVL